VVNAASGGQATAQVVTPGSYVAIYGNRLSGSGSAVAGAIPLPASLGGTQVWLGGVPMPLLYAGPGQVNALVPQALNANTSYQLVVQRGTTISTPAPVTVTGFQPGIYTSDLSGSGQGVVEIAGTSLLAAPASATGRPAVRGSDYLVIFATGLGPVSGSNGEPAPADGAGASLSTLFATRAVVSANIGGVNAPVSFAGLTPSLVGLYQVNVLVPGATATGNAVPLSIAVVDPATGRSTVSNTVTISVQ
jgi:uncharacterized protein (TIGR03437 family)